MEKLFAPGDSLDSLAGNGDALLAARALDHEDIHAVRSDVEDAELPVGYTRDPGGRRIEIEPPS